MVLTVVSPRERANLTGPMSKVMDPVGLSLKAALILHVADARWANNESRSCGPPRPHGKSSHTSGGSNGGVVPMANFIVSLIFICGNGPIGTIARNARFLVKGSTNAKPYFC